MDLSGSGTLGGAGDLLTSQGVREEMGTGSLGGTGSLSSSAERDIVQNMVLDVMDPLLSQAPTALTVMVLGGWADEPVDFAVDGVVIHSDFLDSEGELGPISLLIDEPGAFAGTHTVTVTSTGSPGGTSLFASGTFTLRRAPSMNPRTVGLDSEPVDVPASHTATGVIRWVLQDLMPGGLGSWVMPANPISMSPPPFRRTINQEHTTAIDGKFHLTEPGAEAHPFQFTGYLSTQAEHDQLIAYARLKRRYYLIDHRGRAWTVVSVGVDLVPRLRIRAEDGSFNDWTHDYTMNVLIHTDEWKVPQ